MKTSFPALAALIAVSISTISSAQSLGDAETALIVGNWKVLRSIDPMDDSVQCTGIHNNNYTVQLSEDTLFLKIQGGVQGVTLRFDDNPPSRLRLATEMEKRLSSVQISGHDFSQLSNSSRLRYQVSTLVRGIAAGDLDLDGLGAALDSINRQCPIESSPKTSAVSTSKPTACAASIISKMKEQGLAEEQIAAICR